MGDKDESKPKDTNLTKIELVKTEYETHKAELVKNVAELREDRQDDPAKVNEVIATVEQNIAALDNQIVSIDQNPSASDAQSDAYSKNLEEIKQKSSTISYPIGFRERSPEGSKNAFHCSWNCLYFSGHFYVILKN